MDQGREDPSPGAKTEAFIASRPGEPGSWSQRGPDSAALPAGDRWPIQEQDTWIGTGTSSGAARTKAVNRNAKRLLVYVLDVAATLAQNQVVIDLARRQRKTTGEWGPLRPWYYAPHAAHVKYDPEDRLILALLDEAQGAIASWGVFYSIFRCWVNADLGRPMEQAQAAVHGQVEAMRSAASARAAAERALRGMRRFVLRKDQAGSGRAAGANRATTSSSHRR